MDKINLELLFRSDEDWWNNACLSKMFNKLGTYADGYKLAADKLVEFVHINEQKQDYLVFPIIFLYRHSIELRLKYAIDAGRRLLETGHSYPIHHRIKELWCELRIIAEKVWPEAPRDELNELQKYLDILYEIDPNSFSFRYPTTKQGDPTLSDVSYVNLRYFSDIMQKIDFLLDSIGIGLNNYAEQMEERRREYESEILQYI